MDAKAILERFDFADLNPAIRGTILRALSLLASVESSGDQMVLDLVSEAHTEMVCGEVIQSEWLESVAARIVSDEREKERIRAELAKSEERADKFKWQVRDTCTRAEKAEAKLASVREHAEAMASGWENYNYDNRETFYEMDATVTAYRAATKDAQ